MHGVHSQFGMTGCEMLEIVLPAHGSPDVECTVCHRLLGGRDAGYTAMQRVLGFTGGHSRNQKGSRIR